MIDILGWIIFFSGGFYCVLKNVSSVLLDVSGVRFFILLSCGNYNSFQMVLDVQGVRVGVVCKLFQFRIIVFGFFLYQIIDFGEQGQVFSSVLVYV